MHEISVVTYLLETVEEQARQHGANRVLGIHLVIGERASIVDDSLHFYFDMLTPGTLSHGAKLTTRRVPSQLKCLGCGATYLAGHDFRCPHCGELGHISAEGSEFYIDSIEIERDD
jgi:hydrogenase nickel incorporation protein HypA/HybF